jgi:hypothetical protein
VRTTFENVAPPRTRFANNGEPKKDSENDKERLDSSSEKQTPENDLSSHFVAGFQGFSHSQIEDKFIFVFKHPKPLVDVLECSETLLNASLM